MNSGLFSIKGTVSLELRRFKSLTASDPELSKQIYADGEKLILLASKGEYTQFKRFASSLDNENILAYFSAKALMASLIGSHLMLSTFILDNGYPLTLETVGLPNILHDCLRDLNDYECTAIVKLFISKGFDVNKQEPKTWYSPLHIAVSRCLVETVGELISLGADVNVVGADDVMPLTLAEALDSASHPSHKSKIIDTLLLRGARLTWRRQNAGDGGIRSGGSSFDTNFTSDTEIRAGPASVGRTIPEIPPTPLSAPPPASFNGAQLRAEPHLSAPTPVIRVRFNGASMMLEPVIVPISSLPPANPQSMPLPRVTVSNASGARLQPPPRVPTADSGAGPVSDLSSQLSGLEVVAAVDGSEACESVEEHKDLESSIAPVVEQLLVGTVQISQDGAAMLFSTD